MFVGGDDDNVSAVTFDISWAVKGTCLWGSSGPQLARKPVTASFTSWLDRTSHRPSVPTTSTSSAPCWYCVSGYTFTWRRKGRQEVMEGGDRKWWLALYQDIQYTHFSWRLWSIRVLCRERKSVKESRPFYSPLFLFSHMNTRYHGTTLELSVIRGS